MNMHGAPAPEIIVTTPSLSRKRTRDFWEHAKETRDDQFRSSYAQADWDDRHGIPPDCSIVIEDVSDEQYSVATSSDGPKRRRFSPYEGDSELEIEYTDSTLPSPSLSTQSSSLPPINITNNPAISSRRKLWDEEDWKNLKGLYQRAVKVYESE